MEGISCFLSILKFKGIDQLNQGHWMRANEKWTWIKYFTLNWWCGMSVSGLRLTKTLGMISLTDDTKWSIILNSMIWAFLRTWIQSQGRQRWMHCSSLNQCWLKLHYMFTTKFSSTTHTLVMIGLQSVSYTVTSTLVQTLYLT